MLRRIDCGRTLRRPRNQAISNCSSACRTVPISPWHRRGTHDQTNPAAFLRRMRFSVGTAYFSDRVEHLGIKEVLIAFRSPWQSPYVERLIGSIRRECLDHLIVLNEEHLRRILSLYFEYYHQARTHLSLDRNSPDPRPVQPPDKGKVVAKAYLGGLHHRYTRAA